MPAGRRARAGWRRGCGQHQVTFGNLASRLRGLAAIFPCSCFHPEKAVTPGVTQLCTGLQAAPLGLPPPASVGWWPRPQGLPSTRGIHVPRAAAQQGRDHRVTPGNALPGDFCGSFLLEPQRDLGANGWPRARRGGWMCPGKRLTPPAVSEAGSSLPHSDTALLCRPLCSALPWASPSPCPYYPRWGLLNPSFVPPQP